VSRFCQHIGITFIVLLMLHPLLPALAQNPASVSDEKYPPGSLAELRDKRRALLLVFRAGVVDASDSERPIIDFVLKADPEPQGRYRWVYGQLAKKLNAYIRKYKSLSAAEGLHDADYIIFFNLIEYRRVLNTVYPYGELFVIVKGSPEQHHPPHVIWRAKRVLWAVDAISSLIKELKTIRGES
jgi:hypothetical protein